MKKMYLAGLFLLAGIFGIQPAAQAAHAPAVIAAQDPPPPPSPDKDAPPPGEKTLPGR